MKFTLIILLSCCLLLLGCNADPVIVKKTSGLAGDTVDLVQRAAVNVTDAKVVVDSMTIDNLPATKPTAQTHLAFAAKELKQAGVIAVATEEAAVKDEKKIEAYASTDPMKTKIEWLAGICAIIGVAGLGAGIAGSVLSISFIAGDIKKLCFAIGGAGIVLAIGLGWLVTHWVQIQAGLTWTIIIGVAGFAIYVFVMHGSAKDGTCAFVGAIEAFFVGLWDDFKGWGKAATAIVTGKTGETTLIPPTETKLPSTEPPATVTPPAQTDVSI